GGNPIVLTADARDEYGPVPSPDGERFAFVSNHSGPMVLCIRSAWAVARTPHGAPFPSAIAPQRHRPDA
ncbi:MAG: hypothetical protein ACRELT_06165, partial [Longimicrobiales bacterium]